MTPVLAAPSTPVLRQAHSVLADVFGLGVTQLVVLKWIGLSGLHPVHLQTKFESVVVHEAEEKCRDAIYRRDAGQAVNKAVHTSGLIFTRGRNDTITVANLARNRWALESFLRLIALQSLSCVPACPCFALVFFPTRWHLPDVTISIWVAPADTRGAVFRCRSFYALCLVCHSCLFARAFVCCTHVVAARALMLLLPGWSCCIASSIHCRVPRISTSNEDGLAQAKHFLQECQVRTCCRQHVHGIAAPAYEPWHACLSRPRSSSSTG